MAQNALSTAQDQGFQALAGGDMAGPLIQDSSGLLEKLHVVSVCMELHAVGLALHVLPSAPAEAWNTPAFLLVCLPALPT